MQPAVLTRPKLGLTAVRLRNAAGMRMLPRPSVPIVAGTVRVASATPLPLLDPPGLKPSPHGLTPHVPHANSPQWRWPIRTIPASRRRAQTVESTAATFPCSTALSAVSGRPATPITSFNPIGIPTSGPSSPSPRRASAARAAANASSSYTFSQAE
jgi:hypothetical protein